MKMELSPFMFDRPRNFLSFSFCVDQRHVLARSHIQMNEEKQFVICQTRQGGKGAGREGMQEEKTDRAGRKYREEMDLPRTHTG